MVRLPVIRGAPGILFAVTFRDTSLRAAMLALAFCFLYCFIKVEIVQMSFSFNRDRGPQGTMGYGSWMLMVPKVT